MNIEKDYLKAKKVTDFYEKNLAQENKVKNLETLFFELRKRTRYVEAKIGTVAPHLNGYFDELTLGSAGGSSCYWYVDIYDFTRNKTENKDIEDNIRISMMYKSEYVFKEWFPNLREALKFVQVIYLLKKEDYSFRCIFEQYYLVLEDILSNKDISPQLTLQK
jgi:hypothetical protein